MERLNRIIRLLGLASFLLIASSSFGQEEKFLVNKGNEAYNSGDYIQAQENYTKALELDPNIYVADYNSADVLYKEQKFEEAIEKYKTLSETLEDKELRAKAYHNLGNSYMEAQQYDQSVKALKNSLKLNPSDEDTRYNLAYAMEKLKQQQQDQEKNQDQNKDQNKDQDQKDQQDQNKDQNKDNQDQNENKDQNKDKQDQDQNQDQQDQQNQQPQPNQLSKQDAERMLDALNNDEKQVQKKMKKKKGKGGNEKIEKDW